MQQNILSFLHLKTKSQCSILDQKGVFEHQNRYPNSISIKQDILTQILMVTQVTAKYDQKLFLRNFNSYYHYR